GLRYFWSMTLLRSASFALLFALTAASAGAFEFPFFKSRDALAPRDEWGRLHQMPTLNETDLEHHEAYRLFYYARSRRELANDRAYVGSMQVSLQRMGYYCGPIDGVFSINVIDAIARFQKAHHMRVTGNLTIAVRRALHMP
ncbi:MAG TPA: peptidoglycan-binding domain-containing protein, partial [Chthoniobacterales bacterium]|nr:peptidoglycan-binding domain-containing protein [Chthoniobacterales bacterium]